MKMTILAVVSLCVVLAVVGGAIALRGSRVASTVAPAAVSEAATAAATADGPPLVSTEPVAGEISGSTGGGFDVALSAQVIGTRAPAADGAIAADEYRNSLYDPQTGMTLYWQNDATNLYVGLVSPGTGWAGVGFSERSGKPGSNIIIGAVSDGKVTMHDEYGVTKELHLTDAESCLLASGGSEADGRTTLEFAMPLVSGDSKDVALVPGQTVQIILAYQATKDSFTALHTGFAMTRITLD